MSKTILGLAYLDTGEPCDSSAVGFGRFAHENKLFY
jgi:hypothetical protein